MARLRYKPMLMSAATHYPEAVPSSASLLSSHETKLSHVQRAHVAFTYRLLLRCNGLHIVLNIDMHVLVACSAVRAAEMCHSCWSQPWSDTALDPRLSNSGCDARET